MEHHGIYALHTFWHPSTIFLIWTPSLDPTHQEEMEKPGDLRPDQ